MLKLRTVWLNIDASFFSLPDEMQHKRGKRRREAGNAGVSHVTGIEIAFLGRTQHTSRVPVYAFRR